MRITTQEAANILGVSRSRVNQIVKSGQLKAVVVGGCRYLELSAVQKLKRNPVGRPKTTHRTAAEIFAASKVRKYRG
jgi:excisionase family DNA binding protein